MVTGWEMVPETAKALSAPVAKLLDVLAAGCGTLYSPWGIRRTAAAQGDALVIMEEARGRTEVAKRAAKRLIDVEERRQINIEAITQIAIEQLPDEVSNISVQPDWTARFLREAQDVSNEEMRLLWGKVLAGEVAKPGSFSTRTMSVIANLGQREAGKFQDLCSLVAKVNQTSLITFLTNEVGFGANTQGLMFGDFQELQAAGLISFESSGMISTFSVQRQGPAILYIERPGAILFIATNLTSSPSYKNGMVSFTSAGAELFTIAEWRVVPEHDKRIFDGLIQQGWNVERKRIVERLKNGEFDTADFPYV